MACAVFWDVEHCPLPGGVQTAVAVSTLKTTLLQCFGQIKKFVAYAEVSALTAQARAALHASGVEVRQTDWEEQRCMVMLMDVLFFAVEQAAPATVALVSGNVDFFRHALSRLRDHRYRVVVVAPHAKAAAISGQFQVLPWESTYSSTYPKSLEPLYLAPPPPNGSTPPPPPPRDNGGGASHHHRGGVASSLSNSSLESVTARDQRAQFLGCPQPSPEFVREFMDALYAWVLAQPESKVNTVGLKPFYDKHPTLADRPKTFKLKREVQTHGESRLTFIDGPPGSQWIVASRAPSHSVSSTESSWSTSQSANGSSASSATTTSFLGSFSFVGSSANTRLPPPQPQKINRDASSSPDKYELQSFVHDYEEFVPAAKKAALAQQKEQGGYDIGDIVEAKYESPRRWSRATVVGGPSEKNYEMWQTVKFWDSETNSFRADTIEVPITKMRFVSTKGPVEDAVADVYYECEFECGFEHKSEEVVAAHEAHCPRRPAVAGARVRPIPAPPADEGTASFLNRDSPVARLLRHTFRSFLGGFDDTPTAAAAAQGEEHTHSA